MPTITNNLGALNGKLTRTDNLTAGDEILYTFQIGRQAGLEHSAEITFDHRNGFGDLDISLLQTGSTTPISQSATAGNSEFIQFNDLAAGSYTLRVAGYRGITNPNQNVTANPFTLNISAPETTTVPNTAGNLFANATVLNVANTRFNDSIGTPNETDYFQFNMNSAGLGSHYLNVQYDAEAATGGVALQLFDGAQNPINLTGRLVDVSVPGSTDKIGNAQISLQGLAAGNYYVTVSSANTFNYKLTVDVPQATPDAWTVMTFITADDLERRCCMIEKGDRSRLEGV